VGPPFALSAQVPSAGNLKGWKSVFLAAQPLFDSMKISRET